MHGDKFLDDPKSVLDAHARIAFLLSMALAVSSSRFATLGSAGWPVAATPNDLFPPRPSSQPERTTCKTRCSNGNCYRTYDNGRKVQFQGKQKFNSFTSQWEWDSGGC